MIHGSQGRYNLQAAAAHISKDADGCHCFPIVTVDVDPVCFRKSPAPYTCPPAEYAFRSKFCSIMVSAKVDKSCVVIQYVYAVGATLPSSGIGKSSIQNLTWILCFSVFLSVVLEIADILLFLCIDRNHWQPLFKKIGSFAVYEFKLLIPVRSGVRQPGAFSGLPVCCIPVFPECC